MSRTIFGRGNGVLLSALVLAVSAGIWPWQWAGQVVMAASNDAALSGTVTDDGGEPLRGARVTVSTGQKSISRFADQAGGYVITGLEPGRYEITASAWGFERKQVTRDLAGEAGLDFTLSPEWDVDRLSSADWLSALPHNDETLILRATCIRCHNLSYVVRRRGLEKQQWAAIIQYAMEIRPSESTEGVARYTPEKAERLGTILERYFGPDSPLPQRNQVRHPALADPVLRATFREYQAPTRARIHSIQPDPRGKYVWFSYFRFGDSVPAAKLGRFEIATGEFKDYRPPIGDATFSTLMVSNDSESVWFTAGSALYRLDVRSEEFSRFEPPPNIGDRRALGRTMPDGEDSAGNIWLAGTKIVRFDPKTEQFESFEIPTVSGPLEGHEKNLGNTVAPGQTTFTSNAYALAVDSGDNIWYSVYDVGHIARLNPETGQTKTYRVPAAIKIKGITVGPDDTVWFSPFVRGSLYRLDPDSGRMDEYRPPTPYAELYTPVVGDDGLVWLSDFSGSHLTSFDPETERFIEYPLPAADGMIRFFGLDPEQGVWYVDFETGIIGVLDPGEPGG